MRDFSKNSIDAIEQVVEVYKKKSRVRDAALQLTRSFLCPELHAWFIAIGELDAGGRKLHDLNSSRRGGSPASLESDNC
jgi:hypothetical protein